MYALRWACACATRPAAMVPLILLAATTAGAASDTTRSDPAAYSTDFTDRSAVLSLWTPQESCAHCDKGTKDECTNMTLQATSFGASGMTHTTRALPSSAETACKTSRQVCSSGHMTWNPNLLFGNFSIVARWFPGTGSALKTSTGFIGLDSPGNEASITMGFHGTGWLGGGGEGPHKYQHGIYAHSKDGHNREYTTSEAVSQAFL